MKILIPTFEYPPQIGGISFYLLNTAKNWPKKDDEIVFCAPSMPNDRGFDAKNSWKVYRKKLLFRFFWPRWARMMWHIFKIIRIEKPDIIFVHHALPIGYIALVMKVLFKIPYVIFFHGTDFGFAVNSKSKLKKLEFVIKKADYVVANSEYLRDRIKMYFSHFKPDIRVVYPCPSICEKIEPKLLDEFQKKYNPQKRPLILTCGRLVKRKGQDNVIKSLPIVKEKIPNILYLICGNGSYENDLRILSKELDVGGNVKFIDFVGKAELPYIYGISDIFVMPGRHEVKDDIEGFGIVLLEAAMCGKPIIAGNSGGMPEAVIENETGYLVDALDIDQIADRIIKLLTNKDLADDFGERGRQRILKDFVFSEQLEKIAG
ncbi:MAG: glycosyltransferase family 4 protein [bacterium]